MGSREINLRYKKCEPIDGGSNRYLQNLPNGVEFSFHGICHGHSAPERIIPTMEFEGLPEKEYVVLETTKF
jgi:hypothetical protein